MAYTVDHLYKKVLEGTDKMGSDFFTLPYVMNRLETATNDFIGKTVKYLENTREISDDLMPLYKPYNFPVVVDPNDGDYKVVILPPDYMHLISADVIDEDVTVRETKLYRLGQVSINKRNPNTKPTAEYPTLSTYDTYIRVDSPGTPTFVKGFYLKKPIFGAHGIHDDTDTEIAVDLPETSVDKIIKLIITQIFVSTGDERAPSEFQQAKDFRKR
jgi:hypothetical protein